MFLDLSTIAHAMTRAKSRHGSNGDHGRAGFTLIEMVISISIFMIFTTIVASSFTTLMRANRTANETQKIYFGVRGVFDTFSTELRNGTIDYSTGCEPTPEAQKVCIVQSDGVHRDVYTWDQGNKKLSVQKQSRADLDLAWSTVSPSQAMNDDSLPLNEVKLSVFPSKDPYDGANASDSAVQWQPALTIIMKVKDSTLRTTYSSRTYGQHPLYAGN